MPTVSANPSPFGENVAGDAVGAGEGPSDGGVRSIVNDELFVASTLPARSFALKVTVWRPSVLTRIGPVTGANAAPSTAASSRATPLSASTEVGVTVTSVRKNPGSPCVPPSATLDVGAVRSTLKLIVRLRATVAAPSAGAVARVGLE